MKKLLLTLIGIALIGILVFIGTAHAETPCSNFNPPYVAHFGDHVTSIIHACILLDVEPGKRLLVHPRDEDADYVSITFEPGTMSGGCPAAPLGAPIGSNWATRILSWTNYSGHTPILDGRWTLGDVEFNPNTLNNSCVAYNTWGPPSLSPCHPLAVCTANSAMFCKDLDNVPVKAETCVNTVLGFVVPSFACNCKMVVVVPPLAAPTKTTWGKISAWARNLRTAMQNTSLSTLPQGGSVIQAAVTYLAGIMESEAGKISADPPDPNFTEIVAVTLASVQSVSTANGFTQAQADQLNLLLAKLNQATSKMTAARISLERASGAQDGNGPAWEQAQLDAFDQYVAGVQVALLKIADFADQANNSTLWKKGNKDLRPLLAPFYNTRTMIRSFATDQGLASQ